MTSESFFALAVGGMIALFFGTVLLFAGYRFFIFLLPIFGFFWGFALGAQSIQAVFGDAFLSTVSSWVFGFFLAIGFAVAAYVFYFAAVALIGGALGYAIGVGLLQAIGLNFGLLVWSVGIVLGIIFAVAVLVFNVQKWVIIGATSILGAGVIIATFLFLFGGPLAAAGAESSACRTPGLTVVDDHLHCAGGARRCRAVCVDAAGRHRDIQSICRGLGRGAGLIHQWYTRTCRCPSIRHCYRVLRMMFCQQP